MKRIQRKRTKGWRMPAGAIYVGRPTKWGNQFQIGSNQPDVFVHDGLRVWWSTPRSDDALREARAEAVRLFELHIHDAADLAHLRRELAGHDLACWCPLDQPCHADVLIELVGQGDS